MSTQKGTCLFGKPLFIPRKERPALFRTSRSIFTQPSNYAWGPASTSALPASLPVYLTKFFSKRSQILRLVLPFGSVGVGVAGVENLGVHARQFGRNLKVEVRNLLGGRLQDVAGQNRVDDAAVSLMVMRLPVPFQPVLTRYAFAPFAFIFLTSSSPYLVGCSSRNA